MLKKKR